MSDLLIQSAFHALLLIGGSAFLLYLGAPVDAQAPSARPPRAAPRPR
jgi:hypothetical protein